MRKFILITAMVLASATAQAGVSRGLTLLAANDEPAAVEQAKETPRKRPSLLRRRTRPKHRNSSTGPRP